MTLLLKNLIFTFLVPGTVGIYLPLLIVGDRTAVSGPAFVSGCVLLAIGAAVYAWCVWDFATFGRGTPAPIDAPKNLVVRGLYRYMRNPMYFGVLTVILGWVALYRSVAVFVYALGVYSLFFLFVVIYEEPHLAQEFGSEYEDYRGKVNRWMPRPPRA